jgi:hypothetical protein
MSIQSISFWQQDQNFWANGKAQSQAASANDTLINVMANAETNLGKGLAAIANEAALNRVSDQITSIVQQALQSAGVSAPSTSSSGGSASTSSSSSSSKAATSSTTASPAVGTGTVPLTTSTPLSSLGILPGGTVTVGTGARTTTYTSTGTDTVADLLNAINFDLPTNANVTAELNIKGQLVITSRDTKSAIFIGGSGIDAAAVGFRVGNNTFLPKKAAASSIASTQSSSSSSGTASSTTSAKTSTKSTSTALPTNLALAEQGVSSAAGILSAAGVAGTLIDLLA